MATVSSVVLDLPSSDPNIDESQSFTMQATVNDALHGGMDYDMHFQYRLLPSGSFADIPSSGSELTTADTNPILNHTVKGATSITVTGAGAGSYEVRVRTIDHNDTDAEDLSGTQTVTVNAAAAIFQEAMQPDGNPLPFEPGMVGY